MMFKYPEQHKDLSMKSLSLDEQAECISRGIDFVYLDHSGKTVWIYKIPFRMAKKVNPELLESVVKSEDYAWVEVIGADHSTFNTMLIPILKHKIGWSEIIKTVIHRVDVLLADALEHNA